MDSASSSRSFSTLAMKGSSAESSSLVRPSGRMASASRSKTLMENQRTRFLSHLAEMTLAILVSASSTSGVKHLTPVATLFFWPSAMAVLTSSSRFLLCRADTSMTGTPSLAESFLVSILSPRSSSRSHMLRPTTTGRPASRICVVR